MTPNPVAETPVPNGSKRLGVLYNQIKPSFPNHDSLIVMLAIRKVDYQKTGPVNIPAYVEGIRILLEKH